MNKVLAERRKLKVKKVEKLVLKVLRGDGGPAAAEGNVELDWNRVCRRSVCYPQLAPEV